ncbi:Carboxylesterase type B [Trinorchestia longiramus]|nr:Carboxylesterase type B [Trinorchestia longiramus]
MLQTIKSADHILQSNTYVDNMLQTIKSADHILQTITSVDHALQTITPVDHALQTITSVDHALQIITSVDHVLQTITSVNHALQTITSANHVLQTITSTDHVLQTDSPRQSLADSRLWRFDFEDGPHSFDQRHPDPALAPPIAPGAGHCDELSYFLPGTYEPLEDEKQQRVSQIMLGIVDDFVNARSPGSEWPEVTDEGLECAVVTKDAQLQQGVFMPPDRVKAAEVIFQQQHKIPLFRHEREQEMKLKDEL